MSTIIEATTSAADREDFVMYYLSSGRRDAAQFSLAAVVHSQPSHGRS